MTFYQCPNSIIIDLVENIKVYIHNIIGYRPKYYGMGQNIVML